MTRSSPASVVVAVVCSAALLPAQSPGNRQGATMVYDAGRREVLLFGGGFGIPRSNLTYPGDLWAWNGTSWRVLAPDDGVQPPGRMLPHLAYDPARQRVVMFGGRRERGESVELPGDLWEWDGHRWREAAREGSAILHAVVGWDPRRARVVMFGGINHDGIQTQLKEWDGVRWVVRDRSGPPTGLAPVLAAASATSRAGDLIVVNMQSGNSSDSVASRTWVWNGSAWVSRETGPALTSLHPTAGAADGTIYIYQLPGPWLATPLLHIRSPDGTWTRPSSPTLPRGRFGSAAYDEARKRFVLFGTDQDRGVTWEWDGVRWSQRP